MDRVTGDGAKPSEGDVSVCFYCGALLIFTNDLRQRLMGRDELKQLEEEYPDAWVELMKYRDLIIERLGGIQ